MEDLDDKISSTSFKAQLLEASLRQSDFGYLMYLKTELVYILASSVEWAFKQYPQAT